MKGKAQEKTYIAIDLKSFYASVECVERGLDPLNTNLVVADAERTEKTICLAVSPALKARGVPGRPRLFEVIQKTEEINLLRRRKAPGGEFSGESYTDTELKADHGLKLSYITAQPRMAAYIEASTHIHEVYLKYIAPEDIFVYSIDEVFIDATAYLETYGLSARDLAMKMVLDVFNTTGITATAGVGSNLYLCKVAMDVMAKHIKPDRNGVRIAVLDEAAYRRNLWGHRPITDFWRVGRGSAARLARLGIHTMGDLARFSLSEYGEDRLYKEFGINAELLIDHAWGWEPCTMAAIKAYKPESNSISQGQVLKEPYSMEKARLVVQEMTDMLVLDLVGKRLVTDQLVMTLGYDRENLKSEESRSAYQGSVSLDHYGRLVPKHAHGTENLRQSTSSLKIIMDASMELFDRICSEGLLIRRINITANHVLPEGEGDQASLGQMELSGYMENGRAYEAEIERYEKEKRMQLAAVDIKRKFGKNALIKGMDLEEGATSRERNRQIGGHRA